LKVDIDVIISYYMSLINLDLGVILLCKVQFCQLFVT